jgi:hypothetical protein
MMERLSQWLRRGPAGNLPAAGLTYAARDRAGQVRAGQVMKLAMVLAVGYAALIRYTL